MRYKMNNTYPTTPYICCCTTSWNHNVSKIA